MIYKVFNVALELKQTSANPTFTVIEGDTGNQLHVTVTDGGSALDLTGCRAIAVFSKSNGISMQDSGVEDGGIEIGGTYNNEVTISLFPSSIAPGNVECELQIYSGESMEVLVTTARFNFEANRAMMNEDVLQGTNEYPLLVDLISTVEGFVDVEAARVLAEQARERNEAIRNANEEIRNQNELERIRDESNRDNAEATRVSNENTRIENENLRKGAENQRVLAENDRVTAETARVDAETARVRAEQNRANAESTRETDEQARVSAENQRVLEFAKWLAANATAETLPAGSPATVTLTEVSGAKRFTFGIPKGADGSGTGDMSKSTYDTDGDGIVDKAADADMLGGKLPSEYQEAGSYASPAILRTVTLGVAEWTGAEAPFTQTVTASGVLADTTKQAIHVSPAPGYGTMYGSAGIECTVQAANSLTFSCEAAPESDITVNIVIQEAKV